MGVMHKLSNNMKLINKAVKSICEEKDTDKLFGDLLDLSFQIAGADKGYLIFEDKGDLYIGAARDTSSDNAVVKAIPLKECDNLSKEEVLNVKLTLDTLISNSGENMEIFAAAPYISENMSKSMAILPLVLQVIPFGVLYLEKSLISGAFSAESLEMLKIFSVHIASVRVMQMYMESTRIKDDGKDYPDLVDPLTIRETQVLNLLSEGMSNKEIAKKLDITINTVKGYIKNIYGKLEVNRRVQAIEKAKNLKIIKKK
jgi:histidine kinase